MLFFHDLSKTIENFWYAQQLDHFTLRFSWFSSFILAFGLFFFIYTMETLLLSGKPYFLKEIKIRKSYSNKINTLDVIDKCELLHSNKCTHKTVVYWIRISRIVYTNKVTCNLLNISSKRGTSFSRERYQARFWRILLSWCKLNHFSVNWVYMYTYFLTQTKTFVVVGVVFEGKKNKKNDKKRAHTHSS